MRIKSERTFFILITLIFVSLIVALAFSIRWQIRKGIEESLQWEQFKVQNHCYVAETRRRTEYYRVGYLMHSRNVTDYLWKCDHNWEEWR